MIKYLHSNSIHIPYLQCLGVGCLLGGLLLWNGNPLWWLLTLGVYWLTSCLGITVTFHRFLAHRSFDMKKWKEYLFSLFGALGGTGSPLGWVFVHRRHHRFSDRPGDPHSPSNQGVGVLFGGYEVDFNKFEVRDLIVQPFHRFLHEYYYGILFAWGLLLSLLGGFNLLFFGFIAPTTLQIVVSNLSNYFNHSNYGEQPYPTGDNSRNIPFWLWFTWGEGGGHNYHHWNPGDWKFNKDWWKDPSAWVIRLVRD